MGLTGNGVINKKKRKKKSKRHYCALSAATGCVWVHSAKGGAEPPKTRTVRVLSLCSLNSIKFSELKNNVTAQLPSVNRGVWTCLSWFSSSGSTENATRRLRFQEGWVAKQPLGMDGVQGGTQQSPNRCDLWRRLQRADQLFHSLVQVSYRKRKAMINLQVHRNKRFPTTAGTSYSTLHKIKDNQHWLLKASWFSTTEKS